MIDKRLVIGFIGNGKSANRYHMPFILQRPDKIKIKKIYTQNHSLDIWDEVPGVIYTESLDDLLNDEDIQVVQPFDEREKLHQQRRCARMRQQFRARQRRNRHGPGVDPVGRAELCRFQILERKPVKNHRDHEQVQHESKQKQRRERKEGDFLVPRHMIDEDTAEDHNGLRAHGGTR